MALSIPPEVLAPLPPHSRRLMRLAARMQTGIAAQWWHLWRRTFGARAVLAILRDPPIVDGWEHVVQADHTRPLLLLANHRSYADFFVVASVVLPRSPWASALHFPVRGHYCYEGWPGAALNAFGAGFAAFPPFFRRAETAVTDAWALETLVQWCREGPGRVVGFHPEGTRHRDGDAWSLLPAQPGAGRLILASRAQAVPVFVAGLGNSFAEHRARRTAGERVRVRFGAPVDLSPWDDAPMRARTYVAVGAHVMTRIAELAAADRAAHS
jgi:1-acyl-sn-glycerol-3-phosphate acyltransferase